MATKKKTEKVKVTCITCYFDLQLKKQVLVGDVLEVSPTRAKELKEKHLVK